MLKQFKICRVKNQIDIIIYYVGKDMSLKIKVSFVCFISRWSTVHIEMIWKSVNLKKNEIGKL